MQRKHFIWLCLLAALRGNAAIYQWTDSDGTVQFSDRPPSQQVDVIERRDIEAVVAAAPPPPPQRATAPAKSRSGSSSKTRRATTGPTAREKAQQHCDKLRRRIDTTQSQLRAGYSASRGTKLTERLRADRDTLYHDCRY